MPDATITSTASTFGTITGTLAADQSTVTGTITGIITGTLTGSVGVPGPQGPVGPQGPQGEPGEGVPAGGLEGQILLKASDTSYDTVWADNYANAVKATVRNESGATMTKGTVVYISGASGNKAVVSKASASTEAGSSKTFAILEEDIPTNQNGTAITMGLLKGVDTSAFSPGANLWLSVTPGLIVSPTPPASPAHAVFLGNAVRIHANQGEIEVRIQNGLELGELHDVLLDTPANGQVLKYDSAQALWVNGNALTSVAWGDITGTLSDQTDLQSALDAKQNVSAMSAYLTKAGNLAGLTDLSAARDNLQLGTLNNPVFAGVQITGAGTSVANLGATFLTLSQQGHGQFTIQPSQGIVFPDATIQTTAYPGPPGATTWGSIGGTLSNQTDLQNALNAKYDASNPSGFITASALTGYATESWVTAGFYPLTGNPSGFLTSSALTPYLTIASASATYQTIAGMSSYLTTTAAAAIYQTQAAMASYATESWVTSQGYLTDAPSDGQQYARKDGAWDIVSGGGSSYITSVTSPLSVTSGDLSIDLTGYATESWVTSQGYITSVGFYPLTQDLGYDTSSNDGRLLIDGVFDPTSSGFSSSRLNFGSTTPSSPLNGDLWTNGTTFRYTLGGTTYDIASESYVTTRGYITSSALSAYAPLASPALTGTPTAPTASLGTNTTQIATTAFVLANAGGGGGGGTDVQVFGSSTTSGTFTWTKPAGAKWVEVWLRGGGSGGGSGARYATNSGRAGGGGGSCGAFVRGVFSADDLGSTENVFVGSGGAGGASQTADNTNGNGGSNGVRSTFYKLKALNGVFGGGGTAISGSGGTGRTSYNFFNGVANGSGTGGTTAGSTNPTAITSGPYLSTSAAGGAGALANVTTSAAGGNGGNISESATDSGYLGSAVAGGSGGTAAGVPATNGTTRTYAQGGTGGGGGFYRTGQAGGNGGNGGWPGGGGGGGGASDNGFASGSGGSGANGVVVVITYL